ncbi:ATP-binding cassette domain-containing protein [Candidatus Nomurabacteria bacterium]|nr:ATP-binding cassette domain-containing protein [Candidatus Nomurabacteria bacterium]
MSELTPAISVKNLNKTFKLPHEKTTSLKGSLINTIRRKKGYEEQVALDDIAFEVKKGEFFGIVGRNGSGKSTLLKLISKIYTPDSGDIRVNGRLTPFIELGVGFNPELSGRDNVFLNGALLGFSRSEMSQMYDEIVSFAELERFMDQKLKNYSSGMQVRLAFSIAIRANSDILVLDEVLAVGDANFQQKCFEYFEKVKKENKTIILVTHDMGMVKRFCDRALLIDRSKVKEIGTPDKISRQYELDNLKAASDDEKISNTTLNNAVELLRVIPRSKLQLPKSDNFTFDIEYKLKKSFSVEIGLALITEGVSVMEHNSRDIQTPSEAGTVHKLTYKIPLHNFTPGAYKISVAIFEKKSLDLFGYNSGVSSFIITGKHEGGLVTTRGSWVK